MKKLYFLAALAVLSAATFKAKAQSSDGDFSDLIKSSPEDVTKLFSAYGLPLFKGFGASLNTGWNNTAKTKKFLHFDLRITAAVSQAPNDDRTFDVTKIGLSKNLTPVNSANVIAPTFAGDKDAATPEMRINDANGNQLSTFSLPKGVTQYIPAPNIQLTVGLPKNTDLTIRTTPKIKISDDAGSVSVFGFGIKHNIIQDFAKKGTEKPFDLAIAVNYNRISYSKTLDVKPEAGDAPAPGQTAADFSNQKIDANFGGFNIQAIVSKKFMFFTPFASVGFQTSKTNLNVIGNYPIQSTVPGQGSFYTVVKDPVKISENSLNGVRADVGFQLNLAVLRVYASVGHGGGYTSGNAGIGFGF